MRPLDLAALASGQPGRRPEAAKVSFMARVRNHAAGHQLPLAGAARATA
jgi:hypothetical protein